MRPKYILPPLFILFLIGILLFVRLTPQNIIQVDLPTKTITVGTTTIIAEIAATDAERQQGLSGRASLPQGRGMLFVFSEPGRYGFWMKDMNFPLDMLFATQDGTIVTIDQNLSPQSYLEDPPAVFYPNAPIAYVLEVPAGFAATHGIAVGMKIVVQ